MKIKKPRKFLAELTDLLNKENESSFSFNKSFNEKEESKTSTPYKEENKKKPTHNLLKIQNFNTKLESVFETKNLDDQKNAFLKIYENLLSFQGKIAHVLF